MCPTPHVSYAEYQFTFNLIKKDIDHIKFALETFKTLIGYGFSVKILKVIKSMYSNTTAGVKLYNGITDFSSRKLVCKLFHTSIIAYKSRVIYTTFKTA